MTRHGKTGRCKGKPVERDQELSFHDPPRFSCPDTGTNRFDAGRTRMRHGNSALGYGCTGAAAISTIQGSKWRTQTALALPAMRRDTPLFFGYSACESIALQSALQAMMLRATPR